MNCEQCGAPLNAAASGPVRCPFCGLIAADPRVAALMADRNGNGIPDVIEELAGAEMPPGAVSAAAGFQPAQLSLRHIPPAPRRPSPRARELVLGYQGSQKVLLILGVVFSLTGTLFTLIFCWGLPVDFALLLAGEPRTATVVSTEVQANVKINGRHPTLIHFRYRAGAASIEGASSTLDSAMIRSAVPGATIPIEILPSAPDWARVRGSTYSTMGYLGVLTLIFPLVGFGLLISAVRSNRRETRAFLHGTPHAARVVRLGPDTRTRINGRHPIVLEWSFEVNGKPYKGSISHMEPEMLRPLAVGGQVAILFDQNDPRTNTVYVD